MSNRPHRPWRRLAGLGVLVLGLHASERRDGPALLPSVHAAAAPSALPVQAPPQTNPAAGAQPLPSAQPAAQARPAPPPPPAVDVPDPATLHYRVRARYRGFELDGHAQLQWRHDGGDYDARLEITSWMQTLRVQRSEGRITDGGLAPRLFSDRRRREEAARFERDAGRIVFSTNQPPAELEPGAQDRLSVLFQVGALMAGAPLRHPPGSVLQLQVAGTRDAATWDFTIEGPDTLRLPGGQVQAVRLLRAAQRAHEPALELWLSPGQAYAPVRLRLTEPDGDWLDLQWSRTDKG